MDEKVAATKLSEGFGAKIDEYISHLPMNYEGQLVKQSVMKLKTEMTAMADDIANSTELKNVGQYTRFKLDTRMFRKITSWGNYTLAFADEGDGKPGALGAAYFLRDTSLVKTVA